MSLHNINSCNECQDQVPCPSVCTGCQVLISSDCVNNFTEDLAYSGIIKGQTLTEVFVQFDEYINTKFETTSSYISLINTGAGSQIYKGISPVGKKEIRSLLGSSLISITEGVDDITIAADTVNLGTFVRSNQSTYSINNIGVGASVYKNTTTSLNNTQFNLKKLKSGDNSVIITEGADDINFSVVGAVYQAGTGISIVGNTFSNTLPDQVVSIMGGGVTAVSGTYPNFSISTAAPDGSETKLSAGSNITVSGSGTVASPYTISAGSAPDGSETKLTASTNVTIAGSGTIASPYVISATDTNTTYDGSETKITAGTNVTITGTGTIPNPYVVNTNALNNLYQYQVITLDVDNAYIAANFDGTGLGTNLMLGLAICNGQNGTKNSGGRTTINYDATNYPVMGATGGSKDAVVVDHTHTVGIKSHTNSGGVKGLFDQANGGADENFTTSAPTGGESGIDKNMQPYIVRLEVMKL
jgi:hypothetical protein